MKKRFLASVSAVILAVSMLLQTTAAALSTGTTKQKTSVSVTAAGVYENWDGVTNVAQFRGSNGSISYAIDGKKEVTVVNTKNGKELSKKIKLKKLHPLFGTVIADKKGNYYLVTGEKNTGKDRNKNTVFISKYDKNGKYIVSVADNGSSSLAYYYDSSFHTSVPFDAGCCDAAISGNILAVNYAREMYSGHQSNSIIAVNIDTMKKIKTGEFYNSHSFSQRVVPLSGGFVFASEGDCYSRAFTILGAKASASGFGSRNEGDIFHFWVKKDALKTYDMFVLNDNFAHMGGLAALSNGRTALVGTSVKSLSSSAAKENEQLFIQIFDPFKNLSTSSAYYTQGTRSGVGGPNGDTRVTDHGVKWLTSFGKSVKIKNPQVVSTSKDHFVILYEKYKNGKYKGVFYMVLDGSGKVIKKEKRFSSSAKLNPCEMPVYADGCVCWLANKSGSGKKLFLCSLKVS